MCVDVVAGARVYSQAPSHDSGAEVRRTKTSEEGFYGFCQILHGSFEAIRKISVIRVHKISLYEKQGILEDIDSDCGDSADGTDHHTRSLLVYVSGHSPRSWYHSIS